MLKAKKNALHNLSHIGYWTLSIQPILKQQGFNIFKIAEEFASSVFSSVFLNMPVR